MFNNDKLEKFYEIFENCSEEPKLKIKVQNYEQAKKVFSI